MTPGNGQIYTSPRLFSVQQGNIPALPLPTSSLLPVAQEPSCSPAWSCPQGKIWAAGASHTIPKIHIPGAGQGSRMLPCSTFPFCCWAQSDFGEKQDLGLSWEGSFALPASPQRQGREAGMWWLFVHIIPGGLDSAAPVHQFSQDPKLSPAPSLKRESPGAVIARKNRRNHSARKSTHSRKIQAV